MTVYGNENEKIISNVALQHLFPKNQLNMPSNGFNVSINHCLTTNY